MWSVGDVERVQHYASVDAKKKKKKKKKKMLGTGCYWRFVCSMYRASVFILVRHSLALAADSGRKLYREERLSI